MRLLLSRGQRDAAADVHDPSWRSPARCPCQDRTDAGLPDHEGPRHRRLMELPSQGKTANELADSITSTPTIYAATEQEAIEHAIQETSENTVILTIGAGNITNIAPKILEAIA